MSYFSSLKKCWCGYVSIKIHNLHKIEHFQSELIKFMNQQQIPKI